jgi:hypothetical protein
MPRRNLQFQPEATRDVFASQRRGQVAVGTVPTKETTATPIAKCEGQTFTRKVFQSEERRFIHCVLRES